MRLRFAFVSGLLFLLFLKGACQIEKIYDSLSSSFAARDSLFSSSQLYVHTDKTIYTSSENIWFSAYLLKGSGQLSKYHTLHVLLSHRITHEIAASGRFVMQDGLAAGNLFVADSFPPGDYNFIAYTNTIGDEYLPGYFQQQVSIRYGGGNPFSIDLVQDRPSVDSIRFLARVTNKAMLNATGAAFNYTIFGNERPVITGKSVVSPFGEVLISVPDDPNAVKMELAATVKKEKAAFSARIPLAFLGNQISFRWFPESGHWVNGIPTRTAFEVTDRAGKPVAVGGRLLQDGQLVVAFQSSPSGTGVIEFTPFAGKTYSLLLDDTARKLISASFPEVRATGIVMRIGEAVIKDTIQVRLQSNEPGGKLYLLVHNYRRVYDFWQIDLFNASATVKIPASMLDKGLATITLFNSAFQPIAERTILSGYDSLPVLKLAVDSSVYHRRSKVNLEIDVIDATGAPLNASISMAAVLTRTVDTTGFQDIMPYQLFNDYTAMGIIPRLTMYGMGNKSDLEMMLLVRCWTRYNDPAPDPAIRKLVKGNNLGISGTVKTDRKKARNKPVELTVLAGSGMGTATTDSSGHFILPPEMTALNPDEKITLIVNEKNKDEFSIEMDHQTDSLNAGLASHYYPEARGIKAVMPWNDESLGQMKTLSTVVVKSTAPSSQWGQPGEYVSKTCSDYICMNNILNCSNHRSGTPAVEGGMYYFRGALITYHCPGRNQYGDVKELFHKIQGRYYSKEFYVADYAKFNPPDPEKYSTIFWSQQIPVINGKATIPFYTNDLPGIFTVIVEGISDQGPVTGHHTFRVVE